ncbi:MAG: hypothetical protein FWD82_02130 [Defluviitaleaceae bacterium]|nr:hypothetical protein [Defluviitaleaceae bacterium]
MARGWLLSILVVAGLFFTIIIALILLYDKEQSKDPYEKAPNIIKRHFKLLKRAMITLGTVTLFSGLLLSIQPFFVPSTEEQNIIIPFTLNAHYRTIPLATTDKNAVIYANTSIEVERVVLGSSRNRVSQGIWEMQSNNSKNWTFNANFFETGVYLITITAFGYDGEELIYTLEIDYPNDWLSNVLN